VQNLKFKNKNLRLTCDGGAATGKSTGAKMIAKKYGLTFLSSGLLYRYAAYLTLKIKPKNKVKFLKSKFLNLNYKKLKNLNLHSPKISAESALIAKNLAIRNILKKYQRSFIHKNKKCVIEGRDASTKILPNSDLKFFFICNLDIASKRRFKELKRGNPNITLNTIRKALKLRNISDKKRKHSPLKKHKNAVVVNTGKLSKKAMVTKMSFYVERVLEKKYGN
tara:strand:+ start:2912 stop:3577 length:666 start_codon:yes stop_codon:yes gene_type:complete